MMFLNVFPATLIFSLTKKISPSLLCDPSYTTNLSIIDDFIAIQSS